jgi:hypothetical protein
MNKDVMVSGLKINGDVTPKNVCEGCNLGNQQKHSYPSNVNTKKATIPRKLRHLDLCGPMDTKLMGGVLYYVLFKDDYNAF